MSKVKFIDIKIGQVYATRGGVTIIDESGKTAGWGYDRVRVIEKSSTKLIVETPWGTSCILKDDYPFSATREVEPRAEFKLITTYISKQEIPFDDAIAQGICIENIPLEDLAVEKFLRDLIEYFAIPQSISSAAQEFGETYQKIRYSIDKIANMGKYLINRKDMSEGKTIHITKVKK